MVQTNSFGGSPDHAGGVRPGGPRLRDQQDRRRTGARGGRKFADGRTRYVIGSVGPGTKLPSLGNIAYDPLEARFMCSAAA
jgi:5-methyltetrahydrofolate--homocysteine methyltransferase